MSNLVEYAKNELQIIIDKCEDAEAKEMQQMMSEHLLKMCALFAEEGHSGFSASYAIAMLEKLLRFEPLSPLTGEDSEWMQINDHPEHEKEMKWQNVRCSHVFKRADGTAYDGNARVLVDENDCAWTSFHSRVDITFPYTPKKRYFRQDPITGEPGEEIFK